MLMPDQFRVNEAWIAVRINEDFLFVEDDLSLSSQISLIGRSSCRRIGSFTEFNRMWSGLWRSGTARNFPMKAGDHNYHIHIVDLHNTGPTKAMTLTAFVALCSAVLGKPVQSQLVVLGSMSLGGSIVPVQNLVESLHVAFGAGAKRILLPMVSVGDIPSDSNDMTDKIFMKYSFDKEIASCRMLH